MIIEVIAILCKFSDPTDCHEVSVPNTIAQITMQECVIGSPQIAKWAQEYHPTERLAAWRCAIGKGYEI